MKRGGDPGWHAANNGFHNPNMEKQFHEIPGPRRAASCLKSALKYFKLYFTLELFQTIASQTNLYRQQSQVTNPSPMPWSDVTVEEIMAFIGLVIAMGITNLPEVQDYWSTEPTLYMPWYANICSRNRFELIYQYLHLVNNTTQKSKL